MTQERFTQARQAAATALVQSQEIADFVSAHFPGAALSVYREVIPGNLPPAASCPFVAFGPFTHGQPDKDQQAISHAMPVGIFVQSTGEYADVGGGIFGVSAAVALDGLSALVEQTVSKALLEAGVPFEQDPYLPDDVSWGEYFMAFYLYRVKTTRRINL